jgi:hypothetical protein
MNAQGPDISYYDISFNPSRAVEEIDFVIQRVGYGGADGKIYPDPKYDLLFEGVQQIPLRGGYWYYSTSSDWKKQADKYLELIEGRGFLFHAIDLESGFNNLSPYSSCFCAKWLDYVEKETKQRVILYTNLSLYDMYGWHYCAKYPLWLAWYRLWPFASPNKPIALPKKRTSGQWHIWQWSSELNQGLTRPSPRWGCGANKIDLNVFNGTVDDMWNWVDGKNETISPPSPLPATGKIRGVVIVDGLRIRKTPSLNGEIIGTLAKGVQIYIEEQLVVNSIQWAKFGENLYSAIRVADWNPYIEVFYE